MAQQHLLSPLDATYITQQDVYDQPWKYTGYKKYAWFLGSDDDFLMFRRFGTLNARVLLSMQDEPVVLGERLKELDDEYSEKAAPRLHNGSFRLEKEDQAERKRLLVEIKEKLKEYNEFIVFHSDLRSRPRVPAKDIQHVKYWHVTNEDAIHEKEQPYLNQSDDLIQINPRFKTPLRRFLEKSRFVTMLVCIVGLIMLVAPLWILRYVNDATTRLGTITSFMVVFLCLIPSMTIAKPFETLAATAAYAAVLMVFLQSGVA